MTQPEFIFLGAAALAGARVVAGHVRPLMGVPRSLWLSAAGGVPVAFVFLQSLPSLVSEQRSAHGLGPGLSSLHDPLFLVALLGVERLAQTSRQRREASGSSGPSPAAYWVRVGSYATIDEAIGYLLVRGLAVLALRGRQGARVRRRRLRPPSRALR